MIRVQPAKIIGGFFIYMKKTILSVIFLFIIFTGAQASPKYISLAPSTTEILFALGLDEEIVGVSSFCNYPPQTITKVNVGDFSHPNMEKIISLKPDYIFCTGLEQAPAIEELRSLGFNVYVADPKTVEELLRTIVDIAAITRRGKEANALIWDMKTEIDKIKEKVKPIPKHLRVKVFIEIWYEPLMTAGGGSFVDELITLAGGVNIAHNIPRPYSYFSAENVIRFNPGCIIMAYMDKENPLELIEGRSGWDTIKAVKNKQVFNDINPDTLLRPGPRIIEGLKELYKRLYPEK